MTPRPSARLFSALALASAALAAGAAAATRCHPLGDAGGPYAVECNGAPASVQVDASLSLSCLGDDLTFQWSTDCPGGTFDDPTAEKPLLFLDGPPACPVACRVFVRVTDSTGNFDNDAGSVTVRDTTAPALGIDPAPIACLWPPDHRVVCFPPAMIEARVVDACGGPVTWQLAGCASSEPEDARGDGHHAPDCTIESDGSVCVRAERAGTGPGRRYTLTGEATDACGNATGPGVIGEIVVPHAGCR